MPQISKLKISRHNQQALQNYPRNIIRLDTVHIDLVGPLNTSLGFRYILTMRDSSSGFLVTTPLTGKSSTPIISVLEHHYVGKLSVPTATISDNGQQFNSPRLQKFEKT